MVYPTAAVGRVQTYCQSRPDLNRLGGCMAQSTKGAGALRRRLSQEVAFTLDPRREAWAGEHSVHIGPGLGIATLVDGHADVGEVGEGTGDGDVGQGDRVADQESLPLRRHSFQVIEDRRQLLLLRPV